ncbi:hypothetical protein SLNSH_09495 [Alsobacter soli]|uniref:TRAP transporter substrate-binding protein n=1 Tax=Alsobacter soli TaxID=2109933 RepID=A0A2T1HUS5_9HYPH|nr:TAXI family TRAP transporter solute-binding subunit [Alsobacter soli]PSC05415.1 hypothetical protein SLNSH_09495 [Alsobacter soli]
MKAFARALLATAWIAVAPVALAQTAAAPAASAPAPGESCSAFCQLFKGLGGDRNPPGATQAAAPAQPAPVQAAETPARRHRAPSRAHARRTPASAAEGETAAIREAPAREAAPARETTIDRASPGSIKILTGSDQGMEPTLADLGGVLAPKFKLETVRGKGAPLKELLTLPGIDMAVVSAPTLANAGSASAKLVYVAKLFGEELHLVAGPDIHSVDDLAGKSVYMGPAGSDTETVARAALADHGVDVTPATGSLADALNAVKAGTLAAAFVLAPKPYAPLAEMAQGSAGVHLVPVPFGKLGEAYDPATLTSADYPGLVSDGERIETVSADAILVAPWWRDSSPRQHELTAAATAIFDHFPDLLKEGRHPKWKETNLAAVVDGKRRLKSADQWVHAQMKSRRSGDRAASAGQ